MSGCTFVVIKNDVARYVSCHYSAIQDILEGYDPDKINELSLFLNNGKITDYTDTGFMPAVIINVDKKELINTPFNWFDNFQKYLKIGWTYKELNPS